jgi:hypothetical protein
MRKKYELKFARLKTPCPRFPTGEQLFFCWHGDTHTSANCKGPLALLKECVAIDAGFDPEPDESPSLRVLGSNPEFRNIVVLERFSFEIVESEIETLLAYRVLSCYFIASSAAIVSTPSHRFCRRRFSLAAC